MSATPAGAAQKVIVLLRDQHPETPATKAQAGQRSTVTKTDQTPVKQHIARVGGATTHSYTTLNALAATVPANQVTPLRQDPNVLAVVPDLNWTLTRPSTPTQSPSSGLGQTASTGSTVCPSDPSNPLLEPEALPLTHTASQDPNTPTARSLGYDGSGVKVAFIADGVDVNQPDFIRANGQHVIVDYQDFSGDGTNSTSSGAEALGDAASIAAQGNHVYDLSKYVNTAHPLPAGCNIVVQGMAPGASMVGLKIFSNALLTAPTSTIIQAIDYAVEVDHVDVINESFGSNPYPDTADDPISLFNRDAVDAGVTVVASTGDAGSGGSVGTAATDPWVIGVGASTQFQSYLQTTSYGIQLGNGHYASNQASSLSSGGITQTNRVMDLMAPGDLGWASCSNALLNGEPQYYGCTDFNDKPSDLQLFGGTSESSPLTAGAAALVIQAYRKAHGGASPTPDQVRRVLDSSADDLGLPADQQGAGLLNSYRAVQLAASLNASPTGGGLLFDQPYVSKSATPGAQVTSSVTVTNVGTGTQRVTAAVRQVDQAVGQEQQTFTLNGPAAAQTFIDSYGIQRTYVIRHLSVPVGTDLMTARVAFPGAVGPIVRLSLLDPQGTFTGYSLPQGTGNIGTVLIHNPAPGTWTAIVWTGASSAGYNGSVTLSSVYTADRSAGTVSPASFTLAQGQSTTLRVTTTAPANSATASSLVLTGRFGQSSTLPIVVQAVQPVSANRTATFSGTFVQANGRSYSPGQTNTYRFAVPSGARDLDVTIKVTGAPANSIVAHLSDPNGEPVDTVLNTRPTGATTSVTDSGLQIIHANPSAGVWSLVLELANPVSGAQLPQAYTGTVALNRAQVSSRSVPQHYARISKSSGRTATVTIVNTGPAPQTYFIDARRDQLVNYNLRAVQDATSDPFTASVGLPLQSETVPAWLVPVDTTKITVGASSTAPETFDLMPLDNPTAINAPNDPDTEATVSGNSATATHANMPVASALWAAFPSLIGPFPPNGAAPASVSMKAAIVARAFDSSITSGTGDPLLGTVQANAPAATPLTLPAGSRATITVTIKPTGNVGDRVAGVLNVATLQPYGSAGMSSYTDVVQAIPYSYTVAK